MSATADDPSKSSKRSRCVNFTQSEKDVFVQDILPKYKSIIEQKGTSATTRKEKAAGWKQLCAEFNTISTHCYRSEENLKNLWENIKKLARRADDFTDKGQQRTGGGRRNTPLDPSKNDQRVLQILGPSGIGLENAHDGDAEVRMDDEDAVFFVHQENEEDDPNGAALQHISVIDCGNIVIPDHTYVQNSSISQVSYPQLIQSSEKTSEQDQEGYNWSEPLPRKLYCKKPGALRPASINTSSVTSNGSSTENCNKLINQELEIAKRAKRRRPSIVPNDTQQQLNVAKLRLAEETRKRMENEDKRSQELFEIERKKKEREAELLELQVLKMKRELNMDK